MLRVFVYGTLMPGEANAHLVPVNLVRGVQDAVATGRLYSGGVPFYVPASVLPAQALAPCGGVMPHGWAERVAVDMGFPEERLADAWATVVAGPVVHGVVYTLAGSWAALYGALARLDALEGAYLGTWSRAYSRVLVPAMVYDTVLPVYAYASSSAYTANMRALEGGRWTD